MTAPEWRDCADPDELAAAAAAGVEVRGGINPTWVSLITRARDFAESIEAGTRYRVPASWTWSPEHPADDLASLAETWRVRSDRLIRWAGDPAPQDADKVQFCLGAAAAYREAIADIDDGRPASELFTPPPAPPWPGAVLSGLCDEDGQPTWLAQAGQVRGEQVRQYRKAEWEGCEDHFDDSDQWVEVRAPRAVPEPETERVPWHRALGRTTILDGEPYPIRAVHCDTDDDGTEWPHFMGPGGQMRAFDDGHIKVLKDGNP